MADADDITRLLEHVEAGRNGAMDDLMSAVYADLHGVAQRHMDQQFGRGLPGITMEPAALVNESFLRLLQQRNSYQNRGQFFAIATKVMLRVLTDYQRKRRAAKRGGGCQRVTLSLEGAANPSASPASPATIGVETLVEALERLEALDRRKAEVVRLRVVGGLEMREIAEAVGVSLATVERDWAFAKAWLGREASAARSHE